MSTTIVYKNFSAPDYTLNRFHRPVKAIWDANLHYGDVRPFACPEFMCSSSRTSTLYPITECECGGLSFFTEIIDGFCHDQLFYHFNGRLFNFTKADLCSGETGCLAGPSFPGKPVVNSSECSGCDAVGVSYVVTFVSQNAGILVESAPSPSSNVVSISGSSPNVTISWAEPEEMNLRCPYSFRIYRVESSFEDGTTSMPSEGAEFVFVGEVAGVTTFTDNVPSHQTGAPLTTHQPMAFPAPDGIVSICRTSDGIAVATKHRVYISVPGKPLFTYDGVVEVESTIRAIRAINNTIFVLTDSKPVKIGYHHTDGIMSVDRQVIQKHIPLLSRRSVSVNGDKVFFSSTFSLYSWDISGYGDDINSSLTPLITPEQWKNIEPSGVVGVGYEFGYIFSSTGINYSIMVEFGPDGTDTRNIMSVMPISYINADSFAINQYGNIVYSAGSRVFSWDYRRDVCDDSTIGFDITENEITSKCSSCQCCPWKVELYVDNEGKNRFSRMRVEFDERSASHLSLAFYHCRFGRKEYTLAENLKIVSSRGFPLPGKMCSSQTFCAVISGCGIMSEVRLATSSEELVSSITSEK